MTKQYDVTRYEVGATHDNGKRVMMGFLARKSSKALAEFMAAKAANIRSIIGSPTDCAERKGDLPSIRFDTGWTVGFTGRTQRDANMAQEG